MELPVTAFHTVANVLAYTMDYMVTHLVDLENTGFPVVPTDNEDADHVSTRHLMYLPARYVALLLNLSSYDLQQVWNILYPVIMDADDPVTCAPLLKWLRAVLSQTAAGPSPVAIELSVPLADAALINLCMVLLHQVLPALHQPAKSLELALLQMAASVTNNTNEMHLARDKKQARALLPIYHNRSPRIYGYHQRGTLTSALVSMGKLPKNAMNIKF
jgi:hypothetical protein